jgi:hypothetical protein
MRDIDLASYDLNTPSDRQSVLNRISPTRDEARKYHAVLLAIFRLEMNFRRDADRIDIERPCADGEIDYFEHIYWCGFLLYLVGDPADVPLMWSAKQTDMDTSICFDFQFLVGAGVDATLRYLRDDGDDEIAEYLEDLRKCGELQGESLSRWEKFRIEYFWKPPEAAFQNEA